MRAFGSLAAEVADAGVPGVVAMRYPPRRATTRPHAAATPPTPPTLLR